ncbi:MAG TPA: hypothetical protein VFG04_10010 [Planctomycetaceae bacterium]|jgi:hypothetical protein|nr:hypothetical protein [Planctomycetaceae bacterium]
MPKHSPSTVNASAPATDDATDPSSSASFQGAAPRLLCVCEREPSWVLLTVGLNSVGLAPPRLVWVSSPRAALSRLREEQFDCLVVDIPASLASPTDDNGPFGLIRAARTGGCMEPVVIVGRLLTDAEWNEACACDCDVFVSPRGWESSALGGVVKRSLLRGTLQRENRSLTAANHRRLLRERDESEQLLAHQRQLIAELEALPHPLRQPAGRGAEWLYSNETAQQEATESQENPCEAFAPHYASLLRSYVLMGSGSLAGEISEMTDRLLAARIPPHEALQMHLGCVETLVKGLGNRSARHVMARADLLAVEMMTHLAHRSQAVTSAAAVRSPAAVPLRNVTGTAGIDLSQFGAEA